MAKYSKILVNRICFLIEKDSYTISEICQKVGISEETFHKWKNTKPEFSESIKKARDKFDEYLISEAQKSLIKKVSGYEVEEVKTTYSNGKDNKPQIKEQVKIKKQIAPDTASIIFTLTNKDPKNWKNRQNTELSGDKENPIQTENKNIDLDISSLSSEAKKEIFGQIITNENNKSKK